jgi:hypothetical protein
MQRCATCSGALRAEMGMSEDYHAKAAEFAEKARNIADPTLKLEYERLALGYQYLAARADRNRPTDVIFVAPEDQQQRQQQQQQQIQPEKKPDEKE